MFQIQGLEWPLYLMSGFSAFRWCDDWRGWQELRSRYCKTWQNVAKPIEHFSWKVSSQSFYMLLPLFMKWSWQTWRSSFDHPDPHGIQLNALKDMTLGYNFGYIWQILAVWSRFPRWFWLLICWSQGFWACEMEVVSLTTTSSHTFDHSYVDLWAFRWWYTTDTTDTMGEMKRNDAPNNFSIFFNHFAWLLLEFLKRKDDCGTSWCFLVRSWRLSPKATSGSTFLAFLRYLEAACIVGVEYCTT